MSPSVSAASEKAPLAYASPASSHRVEIVAFRAISSSCSSTAQRLQDDDERDDPVGDQPAREGLQTLEQLVEKRARVRSVIGREEYVTVKRERRNEHLGILPPPGQDPGRRPSLRNAAALSPRANRMRARIEQRSSLHVSRMTRPRIRQERIRLAPPLRSTGPASSRPRCARRAASATARAPRTAPLRAGPWRAARSCARARRARRASRQD